MGIGLHIHICSGQDACKATSSIQGPTTAIYVAMATNWAAFWTVFSMMLRALYLTGQVLGSPGKIGIKLRRVIIAVIRLQSSLIYFAVYLVAQTCTLTSIYTACINWVIVHSRIFARAINPAIESIFHMETIDKGIDNRALV